MHRIKDVLSSLFSKRNLKVEPSDRSLSTTTDNMKQKSVSASTVFPHVDEGEEEDPKLMSQHHQSPTTGNIGKLDLAVKDDQFKAAQNTTTFKVIEGIAHGKFTTAAVKVEDCASRLCYTMKVIPKQETYASTLLNEVQIMKELKHSSPFIHHFHEAYESSGNVFIVSEFLEGGTALQYLSKGFKFSEHQVSILLAELYLGIEHIHSSGYLHCDIKAENIMFDQQGHVKIVDLSLVCKIRDSPGGQVLIQVGNLAQHTAPPELLSNYLGGRFTDWWSYGVVAYELLTGCSPPQQSFSDMISAEGCESVSLPFTSKLFSLPAQHLIESLLCKNWENRLGTNYDAEIKKASFFKHIDWEQTAELKLPSALFLKAGGDRRSAMLVKQNDEMEKNFSMKLFKDMVKPASLPSSNDNNQYYGLKPLAITTKKKEKTDEEDRVIQNGIGEVKRSSSESGSEPSSELEELRDDDFYCISSSTCFQVTTTRTLSWSGASSDGGDSTLSKLFGTLGGVSRTDRSESGGSASSSYSTSSTSEVVPASSE